MVKKILKEVDKNFSFPSINAEYGSTGYQDWLVNEFYLHQEDTVYDVSCKGTSKLSLKEFEEKLFERFGKPAYISESKQKNDPKNIYFLDDNYKFYARCIKMKSREKESEKYSIDILSSNKELIDEHISFFQQFFVDEKVDNVYVISTSNDSLTLNNLGSLGYTFIRENYSDSVLEGFDYVVSEYNKDEPDGGIVIMNGPPGGGKTNLLKGIISSIKNSTVILLPAKLVAEVDSPGIVNLLLEERSDKYGVLEDGADRTKPNPILFIVEDADDCLVPRDGANMSTISSLLNYTDGIFGSMLDLRMICTTNADHMEFDAALLREGRLCRHIVVEELSPEKASEVYKRLSGGKEKKYNKPTTLAKVYSDVKGGFKDAKIDKKTVGFGKT